MKQYFTRTRPDATVPFYEDTEEGMARNNAIRDLMTQHPELVINYQKDDHDPNALSWTSTTEYVDVDAFRAFASLVTALDPNYRNERGAYYTTNKHNLLIEYQIEGMEERGLVVSVGENVTTIRLADGTIVQKPTGQSNT